eukprot:TRINITY_DN1747_c0_g3_i1.p1 TRINITY_DN1747_c0_g3~~TRINITY_DN1747_c0_g3_i1.p1  ORF type:complete len:1706 (+),score=451.42 TRINITY_DN1747_c0_g3_i1:137-5254(+)
MTSERTSRGGEASSRLHGALTASSARRKAGFEEPPRGPAARSDVSRRGATVRPPGADQQRAARAVGRSGNGLGRESAASAVSAATATAAASSGGPAVAAAAPSSAAPVNAVPSGQAFAGQLSVPASEPEEPVGARVSTLPSEMPTHAEGGEKKKGGEAAGACSIRVVARIRPKMLKETGEPEGVEMSHDEASILLTDGRDRRQFTVDEVIDSREGSNARGTQSAVFNRIGRDLLNWSVKGFNICMFAYGHTGSGKTYTMLGNSGGAIQQNENQGLLPRFLREVFKMHGEDPRKQGTHYTCEFYEVYNEQIRDLLAPTRTDRNRKVHVHPKHGVRIDGLSQSVVNNDDEAMSLVSFGNQMRTVAATTMNERSSRSHAVFTFKFELPNIDGQVQRSTVTFVDLAGREDQEASKNSNETFQEMCYINTSLFHLSHLILKLSEGQVQKNSLADFRNSKLTLLLSQALVGNSRTLLLATVAPIQAFFDDSASTLHFAQAAKKIQTKPTMNSKSGQNVVKELERELSSIRKELSEAKCSSVEKEQELLAAQALIAHYKEAWEERVLESAECSKTRTMTAKKLGLSDSTFANAGHPRFDSGQLVPFLTKLSDDESLQGCCNYFLDKGRSMKMGTDDSLCDIVLLGVGLRPVQCEINLTSPDEVTVTLGPRPVEDEGWPRVIVDGQALLPASSEDDDAPQDAEPPTVCMKNGQCIILGYAHAFRLVLPPEEYRSTLEAVPEGSPDLVFTGQLARDLVPNLDLQKGLQHVHEGRDSCTYKKVLPFINSLGQRLASERAEEFLKDINRIAPMIDEANVITKEVHSGELHGDVYLELCVLQNFEGFAANQKPDLLVIVMQRFHALTSFRDAAKSVLSSIKGLVDEKDGAAGDASKRSRAYTESATLTGRRRHRASVILESKVKNPLTHQLGLEDHMRNDNDSLLYVWSLEKFLRRLKEMRELYQEGCEAKEGFKAVRARLYAKPYLSPWREMNLSDTKAIYEDAREQHLIELAMNKRRAESGEEVQPGMSREFSLAQVVRAAKVVEEEVHREASLKATEEKRQNKGPASPAGSDPKEIHLRVTLDEKATTAPRRPARDLTTPTAASAAKDASVEGDEIMRPRGMSSRTRSNTAAAALTGGGGGARGRSPSESSRAPAETSLPASPAGKGPPASPRMERPAQPVAQVAEPPAAAAEELGAASRATATAADAPAPAAQPVQPTPQPTSTAAAAASSAAARESPAPAAAGAALSASCNGIPPAQTVSFSQAALDGGGAAARRQRAVSSGSSPNDAAARLVRQDIDALRSELRSCRNEPGSLAGGNKRLGNLLDRFEDLLTHLTKVPGVMGPAAPLPPSAAFVVQESVTDLALVAEPVHEAHTVTWEDYPQYPAVQKATPRAYPVAALVRSQEGSLRGSRTGSPLPQGSTVTLVQQQPVLPMLQVSPTVLVQMSPALPFQQAHPTLVRTASPPPPPATAVPVMPVPVATTEWRIGGVGGSHVSGAPVGSGPLVPGLTRLPLTTLGVASPPGTTPRDSVGGLPFSAPRQVYRTSSPPPTGRSSSPLLPSSVPLAVPQGDSSTLMEPIMQVQAPQQLSAVPGLPLQGMVGSSSSSLLPGSPRVAGPPPLATFVRNGGSTTLAAAASASALTSLPREPVAVESPREGGSPAMSKVAMAAMNPQQGATVVAGGGWSEPPRGPTPTVRFFAGGSSSAADLRLLQR